MKKPGPDPAINAISAALSIIYGNRSDPNWAVFPQMIKMWLDCPVEETDDRGRKTRTTEARDNRRGIPQGSPISPMLANLYMRRFVLGWKMLGLEQSLGSRIVAY